MATTWPFKDPNDVLDYGFNWSAWLIDDDTIVSTTADVISPGTVIIDSHGQGAVDGVPSGAGTVTWLSGGTVGDTSQIELQIITAAGRTVDQTVAIKVKERT